MSTAELIDAVAQLRSEVANLSAANAAAEVARAGIAEGEDVLWKIDAAIVVFFMQAGFALLEVGSVRSKNTANITMKNLLDTCTCCLVFWLWGWSIAAGDGPFAGTPRLPVFSAGELAPASSLLWFQSYAYMATASTIVSGAIAERTQTSSYISHAVVMAGLVYPVVAHWLWSPSGWLNPRNPSSFLGGAIDCAGGAGVHLTGGIAAITGAVVVGPRAGRFNTITGEPQALPGQSLLFVVLGVFTMWFAWFPFNLGSLHTIRTIEGSGLDAVSRTVVCTVLSAASGGLTSVGLERALGKGRTWSLLQLCNGILGGLVSITAGCAVVTSYSAAIIGALGGALQRSSSYFVLHRLKVDDPVSAFSVHGACGAWSMVATALFASPSFTYAGEGLFYGGVHLLGSNVVAVVAICTWAGCICLALFWALRHVGWLRVSSEFELVGVDIGEHGGPAYGVDPTDAPRPEFPPKYEQEIPAARSAALRHIGSGEAPNSV